MIGTVPYEEAGKICNVLYVYLLYSTIYRGFTRYSQYCVKRLDKI
jgi:hypothetical protein